jgi:hypothetical protein
MPDTVTLIVQGGTTITVPYTSNMNVQQVLEGAYNTFTNPPNLPMLSYWIKYYGATLGYLVSMLDGTTQMGNMYWRLYINNTAVQTGIDATTVHSGDQVQFKYEAYSP